jgi:hypothetical protein
MWLKTMTRVQGHDPLMVGFNFQIKSTPTSCFCDANGLSD